MEKEREIQKIKISNRKRLIDILRNDLIWKVDEKTFVNNLRCALKHTLNEFERELEVENKRRVGVDFLSSFDTSGSLRKKLEE